MLFVASSRMVFPVILGLLVGLSGQPLISQAKGKAKKPVAVDSTAVFQHFDAVSIISTAWADNGVPDKYNSALDSPTFVSKGETDNEVLENFKLTANPIMKDLGFDLVAESNKESIYKSLRLSNAGLLGASKSALCYMPINQIDFEKNLKNITFLGNRSLGRVKGNITNIIITLHPSMTRYGKGDPAFLLSINIYVVGDADYEKAPLNKDRGIRLVDDTAMDTGPYAKSIAMAFQAVDFKQVDNEFRNLAQVVSDIESSTSKEWQEYLQSVDSSRYDARNPYMPGESFYGLSASSDIGRFLPIVERARRAVQKGEGRLTNPVNKMLNETSALVQRGRKGLQHNSTFGKALKLDSEINEKHRVLITSKLDRVEHAISHAAESIRSWDRARNIFK